MLVNSLGLWMSSRFFGGIQYQENLSVILIAGGVLSVVNGLIKPIVVIMSLPFILLSLGLFTLIVNGLMVYLVQYFFSPFHVKSLSAAILAGLVVSLVNYLVTTILETSEE